MILLDPRDHRPIYEQIIEKMSELLAMGALPQDEPLPSVRALASELSINPNTVQRAYVELERRGFIYSIKGKGNFAAEPEHIRETRLGDVGAELDAVLRKAAAHGMREDEALERVRVVFSDAAGGGKPGQAAGKEQPRQAAGNENPENPGQAASNGNPGTGKPRQAAGNENPGTGKPGQAAEQMTGGKNDDSDN